MAKEFEVEDDQGYPQTVYVNVTEESIGEATVMNFVGNRLMNEGSTTSNFLWNNQLAATNTLSSNQSSDMVWYSEAEINSTVFLQQGYKQGVNGTGTRKYNCVAQRELGDSRSVIPSLVPKTTSLNFYTGYRIYDSTDSSVNSALNKRSQQLQIIVMDNAVAMTAGVILAATTVLAF